MSSMCCCTGIQDALEILRRNSEKFIGFSISIYELHCADILEGIPKIILSQVIRAICDFDS